jgi:uncharacterized protein (TIGR00730 family)
MNSLCVFCGASLGTRPAYADAARRFGTLLVERNMTLVYGGAARGLMGVLADTVLAAGGSVIGVMTRSLVDREIAHTGLTEFHVVGSMHERKQKMADLSDGFVALPGGFGTLDETAEVLTWRQLGLIDKPCGLLEVAGFFAPLLRFFDHAVEEGFVGVEQRRMFIVDEDPARLLDRLV